MFGYVRYVLTVNSYIPDKLELDIETYFNINENGLTFSFPIKDDLIWFKGNTSMVLFELYLYWSNITNPIYHLANVGNAYRPYQLIIQE